MSGKKFEYVPCPCCGGDAFARFEVYGRWVRICCKDCGMSSATVPAQKAYDASAAAQLWNKRVENDKPA